MGGIDAMTHGNTYELAPHAVLQHADGEALVMNLATEDMFALNETGADIVRRLTGGQGVDDVVDDLSRAYAVDRADVARDVQALVEDLVARGLLVLRTGSD